MKFIVDQVKLLFVVHTFFYNYFNTYCVYIHKISLVQLFLKERKLSFHKDVKMINQANCVFGRLMKVYGLDIFYTPPIMDLPEWVTSAKLGDFCSIERRRGTG